MSYSKFLKRVLAAQGWYCIVGLKTGAKPKQTFVASIDEVDDVIQRMLDAEYNVYFGCAKYKSNTKRTKENAGYFKSFWLDLDCGAGKDYPDQNTALADLVRFCEELELPAPTLVDSGFGIHCYWRLTEEVTFQEWIQVAEHLKALCKHHKLKADSAVTADAARILRVPGTFNHKVSPPLEVSVLASGARVEFEAFRQMLGTPLALPPVPDYIQQGLSPLQEALMKNRSNRFETIIHKTAEGKGCAQILYILTEQAECDYNLWRSGLSVARNCVDWKTAIHVISDQHPNYSYDLTEEKATDLVDKPYRCSTFESLRPEGCEGCPFNGKIKSPIVLGSEIESATEDTIEYVAPPAEEQTEEEQTETPIVATYKVPQYPFPYFRGKNGGVYTRVEEGEDGEPGVELVYEHDFYVVKRMADKQDGELVLARLHLPRDPPREFVIPLSVMGSKEELRKLIAKNGVISSGKGIDKIMSYLTSASKVQQVEGEAEILRQQMGWVEGERKFILGETEYSVGKTRYSPKSGTTDSVSRWLYAKGDLAEWSRVANVYGKRGFEPHAFAFFTAFGAPLMNLTGYKGAFINLINRESGTGKTTILRMVDSVWGHPHELMSKESDTLNHKMHRLGVLNSLPFTADELSNMSSEKVSYLLYSISQGKGPGRMKSSQNQERENDTTWSTIGVGSANTSMVELLASHKAGASGEIMRLIEYQISRTDILVKEEAFELYEQTLANNYGLAGPVYIEWIVNSLPVVLDLIREVQKGVDARANFNNQDRYHSAVIACNIAGASIAKFLGLIDIDIDRVVEWVINSLVPELKGVVNEQEVAPDNFLGQFMNNNLMNTLIVLDAPDPKTNLPRSPIMEARNALLIRAEIDTKVAYVSTKAFRDYCTENRTMYRQMLKTLKAQGIYMGELKKRLGKGTKNSYTHPVSVYKFKYEIDSSVLGEANANSHD